MRFFLLFFFFISFYSYAQHEVSYNYNDTSETIFVEEPLETGGTAIKINYYNFPPKSSSWLWFVVMPYNEAATYNPRAGGGRLDYSGYIYESGSWTTTFNTEGRFIILIAENPHNIVFRGFIYVDIVKKKLSMDNIVATNETVRVFPNPTEGLFSIKTEYSISEIEIHNQIGQSIVKSTANQFDLSNRPNGIYFATIRNADGTTVKRKIIKK